ncbi:exported protein A EppA [Borreliella garinii]|uniref:exported protein A EppA n=1 Tax=Borreliella garinii TaxID=29519 RepID=UPI00291C5663|nr:exported protein A EppA [Borreliella garinii]
MTYLIDVYLDQIFDYLIQLDFYKIDYAKKYREKAGNRFEQSYSRNKVFRVKQILKQVLADLSKIGFQTFKKTNLGIYCEY